MLKYRDCLRGNGDTISRTNPPAKKRVRFLDNSLAQELIRREKSRLQTKIHALRQKYNFDSKEDFNNGTEVTDYKIHPQESTSRESRNTSYSGFATRNKIRPKTAQDIRTRRSDSLSRLDSLAQPRGRRTSTSALNSLRKSTIVTLSPEHLRLVIPQKAPRTTNQLKDLPADEIDYLVQPKSFKEFQALAEIGLPPSRASSRLSGRTTPNIRRDKPGEQHASNASRQSGKSIQSRGIKLSPTAINYKSQQFPGKAKYKPSFKMTALGVMSMNNNDQQESSDVRKSAGTKTWKELQFFTVRSSTVTVDPVILGGRVLRLRPRKSAWQDKSLNDNAQKRRQSKVNSTGESEDEDVDDDEYDDQSKSQKDDNKDSVNFQRRPACRSIDVFQLTKDLTKCQYLRQRDDDVVNMSDIFRK